MSSEFDTLVALGHDIMAHKYYALATGTILFYDYLLTLADEIKYAWSRKKSWIFWIFIVNRYFPMTWQFWQFALSYGSRSQTIAEVCGKTVFYSAFVFAVCTLLAQVVLTVRIYAVTMKNLPIAVGFAIITACQLVLGMYVVVLAALEGAQPLPSLPLDAYHLCIFVQHRRLEIAYAGISLSFDFLAFLLIIILATKSEAAGLGVPSLLYTIAEDATLYFLVIFTAHIAFELTLNLERQIPIQLLPGPGIMVYLPVMISRIMLSLRKAANPEYQGWSLGEPTAGGTNLQTLNFVRPRSGADWREASGIPLDTYQEP